MRCAERESVLLGTRTELQGRDNYIRQAKDWARDVLETKPLRLTHPDLTDGPIVYNPRHHFSVVAQVECLNVP
jgi:hypothetical protein